MEQTQEFKVTITTQHVTNKMTYQQQEEFDSVQAAIDWLEEYVEYSPVG